MGYEERKARRKETRQANKADRKEGRAARQAKRQGERALQKAVRKEKRRRRRRDLDREVQDSPNTFTNQRVYDNARSMYGLDPGAGTKAMLPKIGYNPTNPGGIKNPTVYKQKKR